MSSTQIGCNVQPSEGRDASHAAKRQRVEGDADIMRVRIDRPRRMCDFLRISSTIVKEVNLRVTRDGISCKTIDNTSTVLLCAFLQCEVDTVPENGHNVRFSTGTLLAGIQAMPPECSMVITQHASSDEVVISSLSSEQPHCERHTLRINTLVEQPQLDLELTSIKFSERIALDMQAVRTAIDTGKRMGSDVLRLTMTRSGDDPETEVKTFNLHTTGDGASLCHSFMTTAGGKEGDPDAAGSTMAEAGGERESKTVVDVSFSLDIIHILTKYMDKSEIQIYIGNEQPLRLEYQLDPDSTSSMNFIVSPKVTSD